MADGGFPLAGRVLGSLADLQGLADDQPALWLKIEARRVLQVALLAEQFFAYEGHFVDGRMLPCPGYDACLRCKAKMGRKGRVVFGMYDLNERRAGLLEVAPRTAMEILAPCDELRIFRGMIFSLRKEGSRQNGRIIVECKRATHPEHLLPEAPDAQGILRKQWADATEARSIWTR